MRVRDRPLRRSWILFSDGNSNGWSIVDDATTNTGSWNVVGGTFEQSVDTNDTNGLDLDGTYHLGTHAILDASLTRDDYAYSVTLTPLTGTTDDIGVVFRLDRYQQQLPLLA